MLEDYMQNNLLRLSEGRILVEQLRLMLSNVASVLVPSSILIVVLVWGLSNISNATPLKIWGAALLSSKLFDAVYARRHLATNIPFDRARRMVAFLILIHVIDGLIWAGLVWVTLDTSTMGGSILVMSVMAAVVGGSMSRLSAVFPVFLAFILAIILFGTIKVWQMNEPSYDVLGIGCILYLLNMILMARNSSRETLAAINLRFDNIALVEQLKIKTDIAETSQREAENANNAKSKFLAAASHDLRQPIHAQGLFLEVLARTEQTPHQKALLANARAASEASSELLNALLDFSRIEAGVIEPQLQPFRLQSLLNKIESELAPQADAKNLVYRSRETHLVVRTDPMLLELILRNLVTNAIRYTNNGGLLVACRQHDTKAVLEVWDTGIGIAPEHHGEVFREFHQLGNPERDRNKGLGLGLAIADGLARTLGNTLTFASIPHRGSVFRLTLDLDNSVTAFQVNMAQSKTRVLNARLLVIDDDETVREGMLHLLRDWGCECEAAETIEEALVLAKLQRPDVVISDYRLREQRTGIEAIAAMRDLLGESLPALLITGDTAPERLREAQASGIPLLHKPVSPGKLYRKLIELQQEFV